MVAVDAGGVSPRANRLLSASPSPIVRDMVPHRILLVAATCAVHLLACGSDDGSPDGSAGPERTVPTDTSASGLATFLDGGRYQESGWTPETDAPRPQESGSPHSTVRVWLNDVGIAGQAEDPENLPVDSMAVKELFEGDTLVGIAALLKTEEGSNPNAWVYYCYGPVGRCSTSDPEASKDDPIYGRGLNVSCGYCHSGIITSGVTPR